MKFAPLILLLLVACEARFKSSSAAQAAPQAAPTITAAPAQQFGHLPPIQLPAGEYFDGFYAIPSVYTNGATEMNQERYFFATTTSIQSNKAPATHTLRDSKGVPVIIVIDPIWQR